MDLKRIKAIIELVKESDIVELEISEGENKLRIANIDKNIDQRITRAIENIYQNTYHAQNVNCNQDQKQSVNNLKSNLDTLNSAATNITDMNHGASLAIEANNSETTDVSATPEIFICSPMVGAFYLAPSPSSPPFVEVGKAIKTGQAICIIEAMKLMNQIDAECDCTIKEILVRDGAAVEYNQRLFSIIKSNGN